MRRELARNFCSYNQAYDTLECLRTTAQWAWTTLSEHAHDPR
eukprot:COSAG01_NODE_8964_length_2601_cov_1.430855_3_plen_42_part_00